MTQIRLSFLTNFSRFHRNNPMIFNEIVKFADKQRLKRHHYSIGFIQIYLVKEIHSRLIIIINPTTLECIWSIKTVKVSFNCAAA